MTPGPNDTVLSDREGLTHQWPVTPCRGCGEFDVEDCQCEVRSMNFTAVVGSIYRLRDGGHGIITCSVGDTLTGLAGSPGDLEAKDIAWDASGNCATDRGLDLVELVRAGSSAHARAMARFKQ